MLYKSGEPMKMKTDDELIAAFQNGNPEGFNELVYRYKNTLYQYIWAMVHDEGAAGDIFQEVFLGFYRRISDYRPEGKLKSYLFTSAHNRILNFFRDQKQEVSLDDTDEEGKAYLQEEIAGTDPQPLEHLEQAELAEKLKQAALKLPQAQREVIYLKQYMTFREAAETLNRPLGSVLADHHRGIQKMKQFLQKEAAL